MKTHALFALSLLLATASLTARADDTACQTIRTADIKTGNDHVQMTSTGYGFAQATPDLYAFGKHICSHLRDESVNGQPAAVYREQYIGKAGSTDSTIWISKATGHLLKQEQDGDITGKGKGHISYRWTGKP